MKQLENKVAIVTGGGSGIGRAIAVLYAREGAKIVVTDVDEKGGLETVAEITATSGNAVFVHVDTSIPDDNKAVVDQALQQFGALHIAVNNAGIGGPISPVGDYPIAGWDKVTAGRFLAVKNFENNIFIFVHMHPPYFCANVLLQKVCPHGAIHKQSFYIHSYCKLFVRIYERR